MMLKQKCKEEFTNSGLSKAIQNAGSVCFNVGIFSVTRALNKLDIYIYIHISKWILLSTGASEKNFSVQRRDFQETVVLEK